MRNIKEDAMRQLKARMNAEVQMSKAKTPSCATSATAVKKPDLRHHNPGRPAGTYDTNSVNYKITVQICGEYKAKKDMNKAEKKAYYKALSIYDR